MITSYSTRAADIQYNILTVCKLITNRTVIIRTLMIDMFNYKLAEIAHEIDQVDLNALTPIDALNTLVRMKEKMK